MHEYDTPASPVVLSAPSVCLYLDTLSSDGEAGPGDVSSHPISISDESTQSGDRDQELSDAEAPQSVHVDLVTPTSPPPPARVQQFIQACSPATATVTLLAAASTTISPNRVRSDCTPGTGDGGTIVSGVPREYGISSPGRLFHKSSGMIMIRYDFLEVLQMI